MLYNGTHGLVRVAVAASVVYTGLVILLRLTGKRSIAKLNAFDFVVTVALGSTLATVVTSRDVPIAEGLLALVSLLALQFALTAFSVRIPWISRAARSAPRLLVKNGVMLEQAMTAERVTRGEVLAALRKDGIARVDDAAALVLETDGSFSVLRKSDREPDTLEGVRQEIR